MPTKELAKRQMIISEFDIVYITQKAVNGQDLANDIVKNHVDELNESLRTYFPYKEILFVEEDIS